MGNDRVSNPWQKRCREVRCGGTPQPACETHALPRRRKSFHYSCSFVVKVLRQALNEGTLRASRNADRFTTLKTFRRPGALRRRVAPGQSRRSDRIGWSEWGRQV